MRRGAAITASAIALLAVLAAGSASAVDVAGTSAGLSWSAASGPVAGYAVQVSRNGGAYVEETRVSGTTTRVSGQVGDTLRVRVAAFDSTGRMGSASTASDAINFTQATTSPPPPPPPPPPPSGGNLAGDVDGDGITDALAFNAKTGELSALLLAADGARTWQSIGHVSEAGMRPVGYADVDGDGQGDVMWRDDASGKNELWLMSGASYTARSLPDQAAGFRVRAFRDFSGDGRADALFYEAASGASTLWTLTGAGRTGVSAVDAAPAGMSLGAVADVDGDGAPDLVWHDAATGAVEAWRMSGATPVAIFSLPNAPAWSVAAGAGDLDGDGTEDLVWSVASGKLRTLNVWFMDGMNTPAQGVALRLGKKTRARGVLDVDSDGRADLVLVTKSGFTAYSVSPTGTQNAAGEMEWSTQSTSLGKLSGAKRWSFLVLQ